MYLPVVLVLYDLLSGAFSISSVFGMFSAHVYYFAQEVYPRMPQSGGQQLINTPMMIKRLINDPQEQAAAENVPGQRRQDPQEGARHRWGQGRPLSK